MAQPQPTSRQGLRTNHRLSNRLAVHRINPALHTPYRQSMKLHEIVLNQTLRESTKIGKANRSKHSFSLFRRDLCLNEIIHGLASSVFGEWCVIYNLTPKTRPRSAGSSPPPAPSCPAGSGSICTPF